MAGYKGPVNAVASACIRCFMPDSMFVWLDAIRQQAVVQDHVSGWAESYYRDWMKVFLLDSGILWYASHRQPHEEISA